MKWINKGTCMCSRQKITGGNKQGRCGLTYIYHRVSVHNHWSGYTCRSVGLHIWYTRGIYSLRNRWERDHVDRGRTIWYHGEGNSQDISKVCHNKQQWETASICLNAKRFVWPDMKRATVLQVVGEGTWSIWVQYQHIWPMRGKKYYKQ